MEALQKGKNERLHAVAFGVVLLCKCAGPEAALTVGLRGEDVLILVPVFLAMIEERASRKGTLGASEAGHRVG